MSKQSFLEWLYSSRIAVEVVVFVGGLCFAGFVILGVCVYGLDKRCDALSERIDVQNRMRIEDEEHNRKLLERAIEDERKLRGISASFIHEQLAKLWGEFQKRPLPTGYTPRIVGSLR